MAASTGCLMEFIVSNVSSKSVPIFNGLGGQYSANPKVARTLLNLSFSSSIMPAKSRSILWFKLSSRGECSRKYDHAFSLHFSATFVARARFLLTFLVDLALWYILLLSSGCSSHHEFTLAILARAVLWRFVRRRP